MSDCVNAAKKIITLTANLTNPLLNCCCLSAKCIAMNIPCMLEVVMCVQEAGEKAETELNKAGDELKAKAEDKKPGQ